MLTTLKFFIIGLFLALLFVNLYFRMKVVKLYRVLVQNRVEFDSSHIFNKQKLGAEILPRYPKQSAEIQAFVGHIRKSILIAASCVLLITLMGYILHLLQ
jgi:hypothetical protein